MSTWAPFWLSLAAPGTGQLLQRSWTAIPWLLLAAATAAVFAASTSLCETSAARVALAVGQAASLIAVGLASALHARRLGKTPPQRRHPRSTSRVRCHPLRRRNVRLSIEISTSRSADELWQRISNLPEFLTVDPFHERLTLMRTGPAAGVHVVLDHCICGIRLRRVGRILQWREGESYAISDLSRRGKGFGFPHVFTYCIERPPGGTTARAKLRVEVRGKWTSPVVPAWLGRLWLIGVCYDHARLLRQAL